MSEREQESTETDVLQAFRRAVDAMNVGRHEEARRALRDLTEEAPGFTWAWQEMTQAALRSGSHRELEEELRRQGKQRPNEPGPRHALGYLSRRLGRPVAKTRRYLQSALERDAACWPAAMELAALDIDMGRPERAEPKFRSLQETFSRLGDLWGEATALNYQGHVARARFDYAAALTIYPRVMKLKMAVGDLAGAAGALSNLGLLALEVGEHRESLKYFRDSLELQERVGDRVGSAHVMILMAAAHEDRGRLEDARSLLRVAQRVVRQLGHERLLVYVLVNQAHVALRGRRFSRAEALLKEALGEAERIGMAREQAGAQLYLSSLARERGRLEEAEAGLARAKSLSRRSRDRLHRVAVATEEAALALRRGEPARALRAARFAMRLHAQHRGLGGGLCVDDLLSWLRLGESLEALGRPRDALAAYRELMEGLDRALPSARRQDLQLDLQALYQRPMERAAAIILEDGSRVPAEAAIESLLLVDAGRARVLRHSFGGQMDGATVSGEARASRARALAALKAAESAFDEQVNSGDESAHLSRLRRRRDDLRTQLEESDRLLEESSGGGEAHLVDDLSLIQESLEETTALVHYLLGEEEVRAWVVTRDVVRAHRLRISPRGLERMVKKYLDGLRAPETAFSLGLGLEAHPSALARKLHEVLLGPFSREIDGRTRLVIVPDGVLHFVPFECLSPPGREPGRWDELEYLIERMSVVTLPSLGQLQRGEIARRRTSSLVAFAASEESVEGRVLDELSHVEGELDFLAPLFPKARVLRGGEATEAAYRRWAGTATHLHLAGHAEVDDGSPAYSGLVLSSGEDGRAGQLLHAREVRHVPLRCELVMLSACSTGLGPLHRGEGALSLARSFLAAGADAVVMSLWRVLDSSTARFAHDFYRALHDGRSRVDALRDAKLGFLRAGRGGTDDRLAHPWFWAPFVLTDTRLVRE